MTVAYGDFTFRLPQPWVLEIRVDRIHERRDKRVLVCVYPARPAKSTLSGAAASNAAVAWLGGGALAAGGGGVAAGNALLALVVALRCGRGNVVTIWPQLKSFGQTLDR